MQPSDTSQLLIDLKRWVTHVHATIRLLMKGAAAGSGRTQARNTSRIGMVLQRLADLRHEQPRWQDLEPPRTGMRVEGRPSGIRVLAEAMEFVETQDKALPAAEFLAVIRKEIPLSGLDAAVNRAWEEIETMRATAIDGRAVVQVMKPAQRRWIVALGKIIEARRRAPSSGSEVSHGAIAHELGIALKTSQNMSGLLRKEGLLGPIPRTALDHLDLTAKGWLAYRTLSDDMGT